jgi:zinc transport system substrate-binding protein
MKMPRTRKYRILPILFLAAAIGISSTAQAAGKNLKVLASTFPMYLITRNVVKDAPSVNLTLMIPADLGCPHDYALTPRDMKELSAADALIVNGLGMEEFIGAPIKKANPKLKIIESAKGIPSLLSSTEKEEPLHDHSEFNPHLFASPRMCALLAMNISAGLSEIDPEGTARYSKNAAAYAEKMSQLAEAFETLGKRLANPRIVTQHGVFDYLARDMGLAVVAVIEAHAGQEPSAAEMLQIVSTIRKEKAGAVFTEPQYPAKIGATIAKEAGIPAAILDPVASGPENTPFDHYETTMRQNLLILEKTLGTR